MNLPMKVCETCGRKFRPKNPNQIFCGIACPALIGGGESFGDELDELDQREREYQQKYRETHKESIAKAKQKWREKKKQERRAQREREQLGS